MKKLLLLLFIGIVGIGNAQSIESVTFSAVASSDDNFQPVMGTPYGASLNGAGGSLEVSASYGEATLTEDAENLGVKGDNLPGSADFNTTVALQYDFTLDGRDAFARIDYAYLSEYFSSVAETGEGSGDYGLVNFKAGINVNAFDIDLFVNNLTNEDDFTWVESFLTGFGDHNRAYRLRPRTVGLNVAYQF